MDDLGFSFENMPTLYLVPLGTGNDLARTLGFGHGADASLNVRDVMRQIADESMASTTLLDRWKVHVKPKKHYGKSGFIFVAEMHACYNVANTKIRPHLRFDPFLILGIQLPSQTIFMQNYLSIGVDALVTYNFHKARESPFYFMSSRLINKLIYFSYGTKDVLERECKDLDKVVKSYSHIHNLTLHSRYVRCRCRHIQFCNLRFLICRF